MTAVVAVKADNRELFGLAVITILLSAIDGSRTFGMIAILGIIHCFRAKTGVIILFVLAAPILFSLIHALRILLVEPDWQPNIIQAVSEVLSVSLIGVIMVSTNSTFW